MAGAPWRSRYAGDAARILELSQDLAAVLQSIDLAETRWLELTEKAESLENDAR